MALKESPDLNCCFLPCKIAKTTAGAENRLVSGLETNKVPRITHDKGIMIIQTVKERKLSEWGLFLGGVGSMGHGRCFLGRGVGFLEPSPSIA